MPTPVIHPFAPQARDATMIEVRRLDAQHPVRRMGLHGHRFFEVVLIVEGLGWHRVDGSAHRAEARSLFVVAPGTLHDCTDPGTARGWILLFAPEALAPRSDLAPSLKAHRLLKVFEDRADAPRPATVLPAERFSFWNATLARIEGELARRDEHYEHAVAAALQLLLIDLARQTLTTDARSDAERGGHDAIERALRYVDAHFLEDLTATHVAAHAGRSLAHLTTLLRERTGLTVGAWIAERRMREARRLLIETDLSSEEIAARIRYSSADAFSRAFRRLYGVSPTTWRRVRR